MHATIAGYSPISRSTFLGGNPTTPFYQCIAVSKTNDPVSGGWYFYAIQIDTNAAGGPPSDMLNDYPKFGLWNDGCLYMGANGFQYPLGNYGGAIFASFNTANLYAGTGLTSSIGYLTYTSGNAYPFSMIPADLLGSSPGSLPPSGTPEYFVAESQTAFAFNVRKFTPGTNCGAGGTLGAATVVNQTSYVYNTTTTDFVPQKGTSTVLLDSLEDRLMQRVQYRRIGSAESIWVVHTTGDGGTTPAQSQWAQINVTGGTINTTPVQQQIFAPDTTKSRWMAAIAVDHQGNAAMGYSRSSSSDYPSIYVAGRLATDPLNDLPQSEVALVAGGGSQIGGAAPYRWGDYSSMTIDPSDDCTFWYTNEYYDTTTHGSSGNWQTRIGSFKFPGCVSFGSAAKLAFTAEPNASYASNAPITVAVSVEDASGNVVTTNTSNVSLTLSGGTVGASLTGTTTVAAVSGVATFSNLKVNKVGTAYKLNAIDGLLTGAASTPFNITVGAPASITYTTQPAAGSNITAGHTFIVIANVKDSGGNPVPGDNVTLAIGNNPGGSTLSGGGTAATDANGNVTFGSVSLNKVGTGYKLSASDGVAPAATSNSFNIVAGTATQLVFTTQPPQPLPAGVLQRTAMGTIAVTEEDQFGNIVSDSSSVVNFTVTACGGPVSLGSATMSSSVATLTNSTQLFYSLTTSPPLLADTPLNVDASTGPLSGTSAPFDVIANPAFIFSDGFEGCRM